MSEMYIMKSVILTSTISNSFILETYILPNIEFLNLID